MRRLLLSVLMVAVVPLAAGGEGSIGVGEESLLLPDGPGEGIQATPDAAFGGGVYLAVWREGWHGKGGKARVFAARISADGQVLDPKGIEVAPCKDGVQEHPRVAFGGGLFLVVWQDFRNGKDYDVLAARISLEGKVLDAEPIAVAAAPRTQALPSVASDGKGFLVAWQGMVGEETAYRGSAAPVSADGKVGAIIETGATPQPELAWGGNCYLAAYGSQTVFTVMLGPEGKPLNSAKWGNQTIRSTKAAAFSLSAAAAKGWLVVGHRSPPDPWGWGGPGAMRAAFVNPDGKLENQDAVKEPAGVKSRLPGWLDFGREKKPGATWPWGQSASAWDGKHSLVVWQRHHLGGEKVTNFENCDLIAARVDGFKSLDEAGVPIAASAAEETRPALASDGAGRVLCVYEKRGPDAGSRIAGRMLTMPQ
ncbi:MAG TPA: hypothetical protein VNE39_17685 [Planctomycetota bacterium]|nr:hypothetical protein [Planctomycetota bacterium]